MFIPPFPIPPKYKELHRLLASINRKLDDLIKISTDIALDSYKEEKTRETHYHCKIDHTISEEMMLYLAKNKSFREAIARSIGAEVMDKFLERLDFDTSMHGA